MTCSRFYSPDTSRKACSSLDATVPTGSVPLHLTTSRDQPNLQPEMLQENRT